MPPPPPATGSVRSITRQQLADAARRGRSPRHRGRRDPARLRRRRTRQRLRARQPREHPVPDRRHPGPGLRRQPVRRFDPGSADPATRDLSGGMPAEFGDRLGAVVNLTTRQASDHPDGTSQLRYGSYKTIEPGAAYSTSSATPSALFVGGSYQYSQRALDPPSVDPSCTTPARPAASSRASTGSRAIAIATSCSRPTRTTASRSRSILRRRRSIPRTRARRISTATTRPRSSRTIPTRPRPRTSCSPRSWFTHKLEHGQLPVAPLYKLSRGVLFGDAAHALGAHVDPARSRAMSRGSRITRGRRCLLVSIAVPSAQGRRRRPTSCTASPISRRTCATTPGGIDPTQTVTGRDKTDALSSGVYAQDHITLGKLIDLGVARVVGSVIATYAEAAGIGTVTAVVSDAGGYLNPSYNDAGVVSGVSWRLRPTRCGALGGLDDTEHRDERHLYARTSLGSAAPDSDRRLFPLRRWVLESFGQWVVDTNKVYDGKLTAANNGVTATVTGMSRIRRSLAQRTRNTRSTGA